MPMSDERDDDIQTRAFQLLEAIRDRTQNSDVPVFVEELAKQFAWEAGPAQAAFRYLADKCWVDTFNIPYTGRINANGHDALRARNRSVGGPPEMNSKTSNASVDIEAEAAIREAIE